MLHNPPATARAGRSIVTRLRFAAVGALILVPLVPLALRYWFLSPESFNQPSTMASVVANAAAVIIAFWMRVAIQTYPGTRAGVILLPSIAVAHGMVVTAMLMARLPYDRVAVLIGFIVHLLWAYGLYFVVQRRLRPRIAVVPLGEVALLDSIDRVDWWTMRSPTLMEADGCDAIVADFSAGLPPEWEALLADAAIEGRVVYQVKQLYESMTGRVRIAHISENSFGSLVPVRGYVHIKTLADWLFAVAILPVAGPLMALVAIAIRLDSKGPALFRQSRVGRRGRPITIYKFRTMELHDTDEGREAAMTSAGDARITRFGAFLRQTRIDELPQIFNILKGEMSWIGPRPEAAVLSSWYTGEIPFYRYRHVVKPGISGWAQVNQGHVAAVDEIHEKLQYDFFYIKYFSPWLDVLIAFKTMRTMLSGFGAR
ncbi:MAG: sugar transferase [Sphingomicrobium sp.]